MAYTREELATQLKSTYAEQGLEGELVELVTGILSEYLYLHHVGT